MTAIPRIRSRTARIEEPKELKGKWAFEISIWTLDGETQVGEPIGPFGPYDTRKEAQDASMGAVRMCAEMWEKDATGEVSGKYFDLKNGGIMRPWDNQ